MADLEPHPFQAQDVVERDHENRHDRIEQDPGKDPQPQAQRRNRQSERRPTHDPSAVGGPTHQPRQQRDEHRQCELSGGTRHLQHGLARVLCNVAAVLDGLNQHAGDVRRDGRGPEVLEDRRGCPDEDRMSCNLMRIEAVLEDIGRGNQLDRRVGPSIVDREIPRGGEIHGPTRRHRERRQRHRRKATPAYGRDAKAVPDAAIRVQRNDRHPQHGRAPGDLGGGKVRDLELAAAGHGLELAEGAQHDTSGLRDRLTEASVVLRIARRREVDVEGDRLGPSDAQAANQLGVPTPGPGPVRICAHALTVERDNHHVGDLRRDRGGPGRSDAKQRVARDTLNGTEQAKADDRGRHCRHDQNRQAVFQKSALEHKI